MIWHSESTAAVLSELQVDRDRGLSAALVEERLHTVGQNIVGRRAARPLFRRFFGLLKRPAILLLLLTAAVATGIAVYDMTKYRPADWLTPVLLILLAVVRCALAAWREWRADRALPTLKALAAPLVHVRRDGVQATISSVVLVPGDIVELHAGELVPADCRLLESFELHCDESSLTGDPLPAEKEAAATATSITPLSERRNMLYAGCTVTGGQAVAVVVETGGNTEAGKAALMRAEEKDAALPLQNGLVKLTAALSVPALLGGVLALCIALFGGAPLLFSLLWGFSLAAALLPEDLSMLTSSVVTATIRKMAKRGALVSRPAVAEEVGRVAVLCTNKTGSFTQNNMSLVRAFAAGRMVKLDQNRTPDDLYSLVQLSTLCCSRHPDPTEQAILHYARTHGIDPADLTASFPRLGEIPFDPDRRRMTAVHLVEGRNIVIVKGAPEDLLPLCRDLPEGVSEAEEFMGAEALRMLAVAYKEIDEAPANCYPEELECDLRFLGIVGLSDPLREDVAAAVAECRTAGIHPVLFTNESLLTAASIARRAGLLTDRSEAISGQEVAAMTDEELAAAVPGLCVCARVSPTDKQRLVAAWRSRGVSVAVTGDGADDVPALRTADIGCAMARSGADVAAASADLVLTDDRFSTLVETVRAGRTVFDNLRKTVVCRLSGMLSLLLTTLLALLIFGVAPLSPLALLWVGLVSAALLIPALAKEPAGQNAMTCPPRHKREGLFARGMSATLLAGLLLTVVTLIAQGMGGVTVGFGVLALGQPLLLLVARSTLPLPRTRLFRAPWTWAGLLLGATLLAAPLLVPAVRDLLGLAILTAAGWQTVLLLLGLVLVATELYKWVRLAVNARRTDGR